MAFNAWYCLLFPIFRENPCECQVISKCPSGETASIDIPCLREVSYLEQSLQNGELSLAELWYRSQPSMDTFALLQPGYTICKHRGLYSSNSSSVHGQYQDVDIYCRASHTGDACRGRGRGRERGISSELADMTCCELHLRCRHRHCRRRRCRCCRRWCCCFWSSFSFSFSFLFLFVLSLSLSLLSSLSSLSSLSWLSLLSSSSSSSSASSSSSLLLLL